MLFTEDEVAYLEHYILSKDYPDFKAAAEHLNCTPGQISQWRYNNKKDRLREPFSERELNLIKRYHGTKSIKEIADMLGRSYYSVRNVANTTLGLCSAHYPSKHDKKIRELGKIKTVKDIAKELNMPLHSVRSYVYRNKIDYVRENGNENHYWRQDNVNAIKKPPRQRWLNKILLRRL